MGNQASTAPIAIDAEGNPIPVEMTATETVETTVTETETVETPQPAPPAPRPPMLKTYVHPFIELVQRRASDQAIIDCMELFMGRSTGDSVDQTQFLAPTLDVFSYAASQGRAKIVDWILQNFIPLQVSYDNNFIYLEAMKQGNQEIADKIVQHESFIPTMDMLDNLLSRKRLDLFAHCMKSPFNRGDMFTYRYTLMYYALENNVNSLNALLSKIKARASNPSIQITDRAYANPRLTPFNQQVDTFMAASQVNMKSYLEAEKAKAQVEAEKARQAELRARAEEQAKIAKAKAEAEKARINAQAQLAEAQAKFAKAEEFERQLNQVKSVASPTRERGQLNSYIYSDDSDSDDE